jgi:hypothetical protein
MTETTDEVPARPATFRAVPMPALIAVGFVAICISPIAFLGGPWFLVFLLPLALGWWVVRTRTTVDVEALRVRSAWGSQRLAWDDLATLRVVERGWVRAVRGDESELALVGVRTRDLGRVAQASGGRITMPTPEEVEDAAAHQRELEATRMRIARLREAEQQTDQQTEQEPEQQTDRDAADATPGEGSERA